MRGFITACFCDWTQETFRRGVMRITDGKRTNRLITRPLRGDEAEGAHYYRKADPDFDRLTYSRCHLKLRRTLAPGDVLFFRTLWREAPYIIGYIEITKKEGVEDPVCFGSPRSQLIHFTLPVTPRLVATLNPWARLTRTRPWNRQVNEFLGRNYLKLDEYRTKLLLAIVDEAAMRCSQ